MVAQAPNVPGQAGGRKPVPGDRERKSSRSEGQTKVTTDRPARKGPEWPGGKQEHACSDKNLHFHNTSTKNQSTLTRKASPGESI